MGNPVQTGDYFSRKTELYIPFAIQIAKFVIKIQVKKKMFSLKWLKVSDLILEAKSFALDEREVNPAGMVGSRTASACSWVRGLRKTFSLSESEPEERLTRWTEVERETTDIEEAQMARFHIIHTWDQRLPPRDFPSSPWSVLVCSSPLFISSLFFSVQLPGTVSASLSLIIIVSSEWRVMLTMK